jgi:hypothetical protein
MPDPIQSGMLAIQAAAFGGLIWYCLETKKVKRQFSATEADFILFAHRPSIFLNALS